jgi:phage terminase large subunit-like protein
MYVSVGYESYSIPDALEHFEERMEIEKNAFPITVLHWPRQEGASKNDRIARLEPDFRGGKFILPRPMLVESEAQKQMRAMGQEHRIFSPVRRKDQDRRVYSMFDLFVNEYLVFPYAQHDDLLDATSRIYDMDPRPPEIINEADCYPEVFSDGI